MQAKVGFHNHVFKPGLLIAINIVHKPNHFDPAQAVFKSKSLSRNGLAVRFFSRTQFTLCGFLFLVIFPVQQDWFASIPALSLARLTMAICLLLLGLFLKVIKGSQHLVKCWQSQTGETDKDFGFGLEFGVVQHLIPLAKFVTSSVVSNLLYF